MRVPVLDEQTSLHFHPPQQNTHHCIHWQESNPGLRYHQTRRRKMIPVGWRGKNSAMVPTSLGKRRKTETSVCCWFCLPEVQEQYVTEYLFYIQLSWIHNRWVLDQGDRTMSITKYSTGVPSLQRGQDWKQLHTSDRCWPHRDPGRGLTSSEGRSRRPTPQLKLFPRNIQAKRTKQASARDAVVL